MLYRQGDVLIKQIDQIPTGLKKQKGNVLVYGESTGHSHRLVDGSVMRDDQNNMYLVLKKDSQIVHEEHDAIDLPKGYYAVIRQREYTSGDMTKLVVD